MGKSNSRTLRAKLSFDEGFAERPLYTLKAFTNEKDKGIYMIKLIESNFSISINDRVQHDKIEIKNFKEEIGEFKRGKKGESIKWTRDERGNIVSPFTKKNSS